ncbi:3161_t:CDS:2, partial [Paraglomus brasilianum]
TIQDGPLILKILVAAEELDLNRLINHIQNFLIEEKTQWLQEDPRPELIFNSENFLSIDEPMLILLLTRDDLAMDEIDITPYWKQQIPLIRWFQIPPADFSRKVRPYKKLLPEALYEDILSYHLPTLNVSFDSTTITSNIVALLATWIDCKSKDASYKLQKNPYDFKLAFRASRDGFNHTTFHRRCDNKGLAFS